MAWRTQAYGATPWVSLFSKMSPDFPEYLGADSLLLQAYNPKIVEAPWIVAGVGLVLTLVTFLYICCCCCVGGSSYSGQKPRSCCLVFLSMLMLVLAVLGVAAFGVAGREVWRMESTLWPELQDDIASAASLSSSFTTVATNTSSFLSTMRWTCSGPETAQAADSARLIVDTAVSASSKAAVALQDLSDSLDHLTDESLDMRAAARVGMLMPLAIVAILTVLVLLIVYCDKFCASPDVSQCCDCFVMRATSPLIVFGMLLITAFVATETGLTVFVDSFCKTGLDENAVALIARETENATDASTLRSVAAYYILGQGSNPIDQDIDVMSLQVTMLSEELPKILQAAEKEGCSKSGDAIEQRMGDLIQQANTTTLTLRNILEPNRIYHYYHEVVYVGVCHSGIAALGWLLLTQVLVGLVCMPVFACSSARFMRKWALWKERSGTFYG